MKTKRDGFEGQKSIVIPRKILHKIERDKDLNDLYLTDIGYYPSAKYHYRKRTNGCGQFILIYCVKGSGWFEINNVKQFVEHNQFFILPKDVAHSYGSDIDNPWTIFWVHFTGKKAGLFFNYNDRKKILPQKIAWNEHRISLFYETYTSLEHGYIYDNIVYSNCCLGHLLASFRFPSNINKSLKEKKVDLIDEVISFMTNNLKRNFTLKELSNRAGLSVSHLTYLFKKKTNHAPLEYFIFLRIQKACQLLQFSNLRIKDICFEIGFQDPLYFSRVFRKLMGFSPRDFKKI
ncbi:MAG: AraC family transcriptional regulator [Bacteroidota bacterium]